MAGANDPLNAQLCALLRAQRILQEIDQRTLASQLKRPQSYVSRYESGQQMLYLDEIVVICAALNVNPMDMISHVMDARTLKMLARLKN